MGGAFVLVIGSTGDYSFMMIEFEWYGLIVWKMTGLVDSIVSWCKYIALPILNWSEGLRCSDCYNVGYP